MLDFEKRRELRMALETKEENNVPIDELTRLRRLVKTAYIEGWLDSRNSEATQEALAYDWDTSFARGAMREGGG